MIRQLVKKVIMFLVKVARINLLGMAYKMRGIGVENDMSKNGENWFIQNILSKVSSKVPVYFDVGANIGEYSAALKSANDRARIYCFEPNNENFLQLQKELPMNAGFKFLNMGLSSKKTDLMLFSSDLSQTTGHATIYADVLNDLHGYESCDGEEAKFDTLDAVVDREGIDTIDLLKIDTEGHELEVLKGGINAIANNRIKVIQFEFNEMNVISRAFLKDFYELLYPKFRIFRLTNRKLIDLGDYTSKNEIFQIQNILAIHQDLIAFLKASDD